jgi:hypothetical protein
MAGTLSKAVACEPATAAQQHVQSILATLTVRASHPCWCVAP